MPTLADINNTLRMYFYFDCHFERLPIISSGCFIGERISKYVFLNKKKTLMPAYVHS